MYKILCCHVKKMLLVNVDVFRKENKKIRKYEIHSNSWMLMHLMDFEDSETEIYRYTLFS